MYRRVRDFAYVGGHASTRHLTEQPHDVKDNDNLSWPAFLVDFDFAIKEQREKASGAHGNAGTQAFTAIGVLLDDEPHSFMHDLESVFWVLFWVCVHYD